MANAPLSETIRELLARQDRLTKEAERARVAWREQRDRVAGLERDRTVAYEIELTKLAGEHDAQWRRAKAEALLAERTYELEIAKSLKGSMYAAWEERLREMDVLKSIANAYNRELRELGG